MATMATMTTRITVTYFHRHLNKYLDIVYDFFSLYIYL
jgi:hypothetical protein